MVVRCGKLHSCFQTLQLPLASWLIALLCMITVHPSGLDGLNVLHYNVIGEKPERSG